jgi:prolyl-tRNA synthetase
MTFKENSVNPTNESAIRPRRSEEYAEWYQQIIRAAELAEPSTVRGCMVIRPWGYALWENIQRFLDAKLKQAGHVNAYFPLFIPLSLLEKEAEHVEGFAKECAVVTHHRLEPGPDGRLVPAGKLEEPLVVRPTSETIIGETYAKWVQSYRDLPLLINQWGNVVRWEMRPRMFLRTSEFLWQEGHTVHETREEAWDETLSILNIYKTFAEEYMAMPVITGEKTARERFPGAQNTLCIEAMMQDRKALQAGTSHFLGQNFAKASNIRFQDRDGKMVYAWTTSWGVSTRLIGGVIMIHGDDNGMIMPPRLSPKHVAILPIIRKQEEENEILTYCQDLAAELQKQSFHERSVEAFVDTRDMNAGEKSWDWIKKGLPVVVEVGPRDMQNNAVYISRRDHDRKDRYSQDKKIFIESISGLLDDIQNTLYRRAKAFQDEHTHSIDDWESFKEFFTPGNKKKPEIHGGFVLSHWCGNSDCEAKINEKLAVTIRCIPLDQRKPEAGRCILCGRKSQQRVVFAKAY